MPQEQFTAITHRFDVMEGGVTFIGNRVATIEHNVTNLRLIGKSYYKR